MLALLLQGRKVYRKTSKIAESIESLSCLQSLLFARATYPRKKASLLVLLLQGRQIDNKRKKHPGAAVARASTQQDWCKKFISGAGKTPEELADFVNEQEMKKFLVSCASGVVPDQAPASQVSTHCHNLLASVTQGWCPTRHLQHRSVLTVTSSWPLCHRAGEPPGTYSTGQCSLLQAPGLCAKGLVPDQAPASQVSAHCHNLLASVTQGWCPTRHLQNWSVLTVTSS